MKQKTFLAALLCAASPLAHSTETLHEVVVTTSRFDNSTENAPVNVKLISAESIRNSTARTLPELLAQQAGIQVRSSDGSPNMMIDLRGFGMSGNQNTLVLLDGLPLNDIDLNSIRWSSIPLDSIERIEIINGSGAVLYGGGASGGTINIITRTSLHQQEATLRGSLGSYGTREWHLSAGAGNDSTGMHLSASTQESDGYRSNSAFSQSNLQGDVRTQAGNGDVFVKFGIDSQHLRLPGVRRVDPSTGLNQVVTDPREATTPLDYANQTGGNITLGTLQKWSLGEFAAELHYRDDRQQAYYDAFGGTYIDTRLDLLSLTPRFKMHFPLGGIANTLVIGVDLADWSYDSGRASNPSTINNPAAHIHAKQQNRALYAQNSTQLNDDTVLTLGMRTQHTAYRANDSINPASYALGEQNYSVNAYEAGLRHNLNADWAMYGRIGRSFRMATVDEIYDQFGGPLFDSRISMLQPQKSQDTEIGMDYSHAGTNIRAAVYHMNLSNEIHYNAVTFTNMNLSPTRRYGLELEGMHGFGSGLELRAAYTYTVAKFREGLYGGVNLSGNRLPLVPQHRLALSLLWPVTENTQLSASALYVGKQHFDNDQANTFGQMMPGYSTADLKLSHQQGNWTFAATINNLFNKKYFTYAVASTFAAGVYNAYPLAERHVLVSAQYRY